MEGNHTQMKQKYTLKNTLAAVPLLAAILLTALPHQAAALQMPSNGSELASMVGISAPSYHGTEIFG